MKRKHLGLIAGLMLILAGCGPKAEPPITDYKEAFTVESKVPDTAEEKKEAFYGDWKVTSSLGTRDVYAMSQEDIEAMAGTSLKYEEGLFSWNGETAQVQEYIMETLTAEALEADYQIKLSELGIVASNLTHIEVVTEGDVSFGTQFYVIDDSTLMISSDGVFFEAKRDVTE